MRYFPLVYRDVNLPDDGLNGARGMLNGLILGCAFWAIAFGIYLY
jgi:hypothetical protein